ncbi:MAG: hypothetical protein NTZ16_11640 [Verrucomicrobia bacterium]|nr:hypothetical protein [Verrucomicrobiota bacterium]
MPLYQIISATSQPCALAGRQTHVIGVSTAIVGGERRRWSMTEIVKALNNCDVFYTVSHREKSVALVELTCCVHCQRIFLRSRANAAPDSRLEQLPPCPPTT